MVTEWRHCSRFQAALLCWFFLQGEAPQDRSKGGCKAWPSVELSWVLQPALSSAGKKALEAWGGGQWTVLGVFGKALRMATIHSHPWSFLAPLQGAFKKRGEGGGGCPQSGRESSKDDCYLLPPLKKKKWDRKRAAPEIFVIMLR